MERELVFPKEDEEFYACLDREHHLQAMIAIVPTRNEIYVDYLVTNPINIRSDVNRFEPHKVRGAGSCLLRAAEWLAITRNKSQVSLCPLSSAVGFYLANGYTQSDWEMCKTADKIAQLDLPMVA